MGSDLGVDPQLDQRAAAGGVEGRQGPGVALHRASATEDARGEGDAHLGHGQGGCEDGVDEVLAGVGAHLDQGALRAGEDDGPGERPEHEGEGAGAVRHRVGAVDDDDAGEGLRDEGLVDGAGEVDPVGGLHVARVEVAEDARRDVRGASEDGELGEEIASVGVGPELAGAGGLHHQRTAGVQDEDARHGAHRIKRRAGRS